MTVRELAPHDSPEIHWSQHFSDQDAQDWHHGAGGSCSLISYTPTVPDSSVKRSEQFFVPELNFTKLGMPKIHRQSSTDSTGFGQQRLSPQKSDPVVPDTALKSDDFESPFSGLLHLRNFSLSTAHNNSSFGPSNFCHHSHYEVGEITYMFGGLYANAALALKQMGIPKGTDISQVSVHFPVDMPPFVNKQVLMSPLMARNPTFITFNSLRSTVHNESRPELEKAEPSHLCEMKGTRISSSQVFFCGGYKINVDKVYYDEQRRRWIVEKSISLNENGYILDVRRLNFTKINLLTNSEFVYGGRVGAEVCSSLFDTDAALNEPKHSSVPTPVQSESVGSFEPVKLKTDDKNVKTATRLNPAYPGATSPEMSPVEPSTPSSIKPMKAQLSDSKDSKSELEKKRLEKEKPSRSASLQRTPSTRYAAEPAMHSSYANHVKQHRSKTPVSAAVDSRHVSPAITPQKARSLVNSDAETGDNDSDSSRSASSIKEFHYPAPTAKPSIVMDHTERVTSPDDLKRPETPQSFLMSENPKSGIFSVCVYVFGGFVLKRSPDNRQCFEATNDFLKIELTVDDAAKGHYHRDALLIEVQTKGAVQPTPRGYFAHVVIPNGLSNDLCYIDNNHARFMSDVDSYSIHSEVHSTNDSVSTSRMFNGDSFFESKQLVIHGGVDHTFQTFGDFYTFDFEKEEWTLITSYSYDYYNIDKQPYEDEDSSLLQLEKQLTNPQIVEAELRCCHHKAISYWEGKNEYVTFVGGFTNEYLRHFDQTPYTSSKYDVSRLAKLSLSATNSNLLRVPVLDFRTQMWKYKRYFYDFSEGVSSEFLDIVRQPHMQNARLVFSGGAVSIVGKQLTFCQGLATFVPEKSEHFGVLQQQTGADTLFVGGHFNLTFPGM